MSSRLRLRQGQSCRPSAALWVVLLGLPALCLAANPAELLQSCLSDQQAAAPGANFKAFLQGQHPRLLVHDILWSAKQPCKSTDAGAGGVAPDSEECPLTVATTLTTSRLSGLQRLCQSWPGPLAAAVYLTVNLPAGQSTADPDTLAHFRTRLSNDSTDARALFRKMEAATDACALRLLIVYEVLQDSVMHMLIPINSLRNMALLAATTPLVSMIDVDLIVSAALGEQLISGPKQQRSGRSKELIAMCQDKAAFILPALEPHTGRRAPLDQLLQWADHSVTVSKDGLVDMVQRQEMCFFQELSYPRGHRLTNFPRWFGSHWPYQVYWQMFYEPWFLLSRTHNHWYDVRFQGYGYNKQNHVAGLAISGVKFLVHPDAWVVHRPHDKTAVQRLYVVALNNRAKMQKAGREVELPTNFTDASALSSSQVGALLQHHVKKMFLENQRLAKEGRYVPQIDAATKRCLASLPWWQGQSLGRL